MKFIDLYKDIKANVLEAIENQDYPLDAIIGKLNIKRDMNRNPLFDTMFSMLNMEKTDIKVDDVDISAVNIANNVAKFDLTIEVEENDNQITMMWEYKTGLFDDSTIDRMFESFIYIADSIDNEQITLDEMELMNENVTARMLATVNDTKVLYDRDKCVAKIIEESVLRNPDTLALDYHGKEITYRELNERANQIARMLLKKKVTTGGRIALIMKRDEYLLECLLASLKIGAAYIPIDHTYPKERMEFVLNDSHANVILTNTEVAEYCLTEELSIIDVTKEELDSFPRTDLELTFDSENDAYVIYTSGSTGNPKGVRLSHRAVNNFIHAMQREIDFRSGKSILTLTTVSFDIFVLESIVPLASGMKLVLADEYQQLDPQALCSLIKDSQVDMLQMTPSRAQMLIKYCNDETVFLEVRDIMLGGEAVPLQLVNSIKAMTAARIYNMYGPTETTVWSSVSNLTDKDKIDVGHPIANTQMYIVNSRNVPQPIGVVGELCIAGDGLSNGYLDRDELNNERFVDNPFIPGAKMYKTGDQASFNSDLTIRILGRMDNQVKVRGYRIELEEIETQVLRFNGIKEAVSAVKGNEDSEKYIVAYYIADTEIDIEALRQFLSKSLTEYMMPSYYVKLIQIPTTPNGKTDRNRLPEVNLQPEKKTIGSSATEFADEIEENIYRIWIEVLGVNSFGVEDNFFEVGGTSISVIKLQSKINELYPQKLTVTDLFELTTVKAIAKFLCKDGTGEEGMKQQQVLNMKQSNDIAVIGISAKLPGGMEAGGFWQELCKGTDFISEVDENRKKDVLQYVNYANREWNQKVNNVDFLNGAFLQDIDKFDYEYFRISPREAGLMDPNQRLLLQTIWSAIEDAGYGDGSLNGSQTGIYIGNSDDFGINYRRMIEADKNAEDGIAMLGNVKSVMAGRIAYMMDFKGPSLVVDTACSSSLVAVNLACRDIREGNCSQAIVGASNLILMPLITKQKIGIEASDNHAKTFDDRSDGTGLGEGVIAVLLKPLKVAMADRDNIYAVIKGSAVNQDGNSIGLTAPNANAQKDALIKACEAAGISGETLGYIEAHGTGTKLGDPVEIQGITKALRTYTEKRQFCAIGALKTNIGHLDNCAGLAGFLKAVLMLKNKKIPPTLHFDIPNKKIPFEESPVYVNDILRDWNSEDKPRRCAVNAFGLSGTNCCVILEESPEVSVDRQPEETNEIFTLSAMNQQSLVELVSKYITYMEMNTSDSLQDICYTVNTGRRDMKHRIAFVVKDKTELLCNLKDFYMKHIVVEE